MAQTTFERSQLRDHELPATLDLSGLPRTAYIPLLAVLFGIGLGLYVSVEPTRPWILLVLVGLVALGSDGILRTHPRAQFRGVADTAPFLFVPVLFALASGLFLDEIVSGYRTVPAVAGASVLFAACLCGEYASVTTRSQSYALGRLLLSLLTYLAAFGFYAVVYAFDIDLVQASIAIGLFSALLAVEIFREAETDVYHALVFSAAIGVVVAEIRWAMYFIPLEGFLAALVLLLVFYLATGIVQHHLTRDLSRGIAAEFGLVTAVGLAVVIVGRVFSIG